MNGSKLVSIIAAVCLLLTTTTSITGCTFMSQPVLDPSTVIEISGDIRRTFIVTDSDELWVSGLNEVGQLGLALQDRRLTKADKLVSWHPWHADYVKLPIRLQRSVKQADSYHYASAYVTKSGELWVMGYERGVTYFPEVRRKLRLVTVRDPEGLVRPIKVMDGVKKISGGNHLLILLENGDLMGVGESNWGELGSIALRDEPRIIDTEVLDVHASGNKTFYLKADGSLYSCGQNRWGELGFGEPSEWEDYPVVGEDDAYPPVPNFPPQQIAQDVQNVYCDGNCTLILKNNGDLYMIGLFVDNVYQNSGEYFTEPQFVSEDVCKMGIAELDAGKAIIIKKNDGRLLGWGNGLTALGIGGSTEQWCEIVPNVKDFWTTPNLFVLKQDGSMLAAGASRWIKDWEIRDLTVGQLAGWSWTD